MLDLGFFSSLGFFVIAAFGLLVFWILGALARIRYFSWLSPQLNITLVSSFVLILSFTGWWKVLIFVFFQFGYSRVVFALRHRVPRLILLLPALLPMLLAKTWFIGAEGYGILGLSFLTFRAAQIILDFDREAVSILDYISFMVFFPTLLMGPLVRFEDFHKELLRPEVTRPTPQKLEYGGRFFLIGVAQKFVFAELISRYALGGHNGVVPWKSLEIFSYPAFLFCDFSGYSLMAAGLAFAMGFQISLNFDKPWLAKNPQDFWKRWHISLSDWLRDYFFRPTYRFLRSFRVGKNHGLAIQNFALFATLFLMGIWNGLSFRYVLSGTLFGLASVAHNSVLHFRKGKTPFGRWQLLLGRVATLVSGAFALLVFSGRPGFVQHTERRITQMLWSESNEGFWPVLHVSQSAGKLNLSVPVSASADFVLMTQRPGKHYWDTVDGPLQVASWFKGQVALRRGNKFHIVPISLVQRMQTADFSGQLWILREQTDCGKGFNATVTNFGTSFGIGLMGEFFPKAFEFNLIEVSHIPPPPRAAETISVSHREQVQKGYFHIHAPNVGPDGTRSLETGKHLIRSRFFARSTVVPGLDIGGFYCESEKQLRVGS